MQDLLRVILKWGLRLFLKPVFSGWMPIGIQRFWFRVMSATNLPPRGMRFAAVTMNGVPAEQLLVGEGGARVVLYLHGGGYCIGSPATHRPLAARIAHAAGATCYVPDYRLAPEHPHPAALDDALAAYRWLLSQGHKPADLALGGDSAGGGLVLACAVAMRDSGLALPAALVLISPWSDLTLSGRTGATHAWRDPILSRAIVALWAKCYLGTQPADHPLCSPLFAKLTGLPPVLIQVGSEEILLDDSVRLAERARAAGVKVTLTQYEGMWHDFQVHAPVLHDSARAIAEIGGFLRAHWR